MRHEGRQESLIKQEFHSFVHYYNYTTVLNALRLTVLVTFPVCFKKGDSATLQNLKQN